MGYGATALLVLGALMAHVPDWPLVLDGGAWGVIVWGSGQPRPAHPPSHSKQVFPQRKSKFHSRGRKFETDFRYFFFGLSTPPPPSTGVRHSKQ